MKFLTIFLTILILATTGCASKGVQLTPTEQRQAQAIQRGEDVSKELQGKSGEGDITEEELARRERAKALSLKEIIEKAPLKDIFFEFDSYSIKSEYFSRLTEIASWLQQYKDIKIAVEGHCDERGTIEYNLALGQKRAETVKNHLVKLGVDGTRIKTISYGKELPSDSSHTEDAWTKNRRAGFKIDQKG